MGYNARICVCVCLCVSTEKGSMTRDMTIKEFQVIFQQNIRNQIQIYNTTVQSKIWKTP